MTFAILNQYLSLGAIDELRMHIVPITHVTLRRPGR
jgi:hypothetical protein